MQEKTLSIEAEDGSRTSVPEFLADDIPNPQWNELWNKVNAGTVITRVIAGAGINERVVLDDDAEAKHLAEQAVSAAVMKAKQDKTVVVTVDDGTMPISVEEIELQSIADDSAKTKVAIRTAASKGVSINDVDVKTYSEHYGG